MLGGLGLVLGLIFMLAGTPNHWFAGVHTVGLILLLVDMIPWAIIALLVFFGVWRD